MIKEIQIDFYVKHFLKIKIKIKLNLYKNINI